MFKTNKLHRFFQGFICITLSLSFIFTQTVLADSRDVYTIKVPEKLGKVKERFQGQGDLVLIHIQDAHSNLEAQQNLAGLIEHFVSTDTTNIVGVEGASTPVSLEGVRQFPHKEAKQEVGMREMKAGRLGGVAYQATVNAKPFNIVGIENEDLFGKDFDAFINAARGKDDILQQLEEVEQILNQLKTPIYQTELANLDRTIAKYESDEIDFLEYYIALNNLAERAQVNLESYVQFLQFKEAAILGSNVNFEKLKSEREALESELTGLLIGEGTAQGVQRFEKFSQQYKSGEIEDKDYYKYLRNLGYQFNVNWRKYPNVHLNTGYMERYAKVDIAQLMQESKAVQMELMRKLAKSDAERQLIHALRAVQVLKLMAGLKAVSEDLNYFNANRQDFTSEAILGFAKAMSAQYGIDASTIGDKAKWLDNLSKIEKFYELAKNRDQFLVKNMVNAIRGAGKDKGVVVTGGFHTDGMTELFRKEGVSYMVITPEISKAHENVPYFSAMMQSQLFTTPQASYITQFLPKDAAYRQGFSEAQFDAAVRAAIAALPEDQRTPARIFAALQGIVLNLDQTTIALRAIAQLPNSDTLVAVYEVSGVGRRTEYLVSAFRVATPMETAEVPQTFLDEAGLRAVAVPQEVQEALDRGQPQDVRAILQANPEVARQAVRGLLVPGLYTAQNDPTGGLGRLGARGVIGFVFSDVEAIRGALAASLTGAPLLPTGTFVPGTQISALPTTDNLSVLGQTLNNLPFTVASSVVVPFTIPAVRVQTQATGDQLGQDVLVTSTPISNVPAELLPLVEGVNGQPGILQPIVRDASVGIEGFVVLDSAAFSDFLVENLPVNGTLIPLSGARPVTTISPLDALIAAGVASPQVPGVVQPVAGVAGTPALATAPQGPVSGIGETGVAGTPALSAAPQGPTTTSSAITPVATSVVPTLGLPALPSLASVDNAPAVVQAIRDAVSARGEEANAAYVIDAAFIQDLAKAERVYTLSQMRDAIREVQGITGVKFVVASDTLERAQVEELATYVGVQQTQTIARGETDPQQLQILLGAATANTLINVLASTEDRAGVLGDIVAQASNIGQVPTANRLSWILGQVQVGEFVSEGDTVLSSLLLSLRDGRDPATISANNLSAFGGQFIIPSAAALTDMEKVLQNALRAKEREHQLAIAA